MVAMNEQWAAKPHRYNLNAVICKQCLCKSADKIRAFDARSLNTDRYCWLTFTFVNHQWMSPIRQRKVSLYRCTLSDSNQPLFKLKFVCKNWNRCEHWIACVSNFLPTATWIADLCSTLRRLLSAYIRSYMLHVPNSAEENCLTEKQNHTLCLKSDIKPKNLGITKM